MNINTLIAALPVLGVMLGFAKVRYPRVPWLAAGSMLFVYLVFEAVTGAWAGACWSCGGETGTARSELFYVTTLYFGIVIATTLVGIWLGSRMIVVLGRLGRTIAELRGRG